MLLTKSSITSDIYLTQPSVDGSAATVSVSATQYRRTVY